MTNRRVFVLCAAVAASACAAWRGAADEPVATDSPAATIASLQQSLLAARDKPNATVEDRYRALEPAIVETHNLPYIAEFALRRQWSMLTGEERQRFVAAFQRLSVMTYAARFGNVARDAFRPIEAGAAALVSMLRWAGDAPARRRFQRVATALRPGPACSPAPPPRRGSRR